MFNSELLLRTTGPASGQSGIWTYLILLDIPATTTWLQCLYYHIKVTDILEEWKISLKKQPSRWPKFTLMPTMKEPFYNRTGTQKSQCNTSKLSFWSEDTNKNPVRWEITSNSFRSFAASARNTNMADSFGRAHVYLRKVLVPGIYIIHDLLSTFSLEITKKLSLVCLLTASHNKICNFLSHLSVNWVSSNQQSKERLTCGMSRFRNRFRVHYFTL